MNTSLFTTRNLLIAIAAASFILVAASSTVVAVKNNNRISMGVQSMGTSLSGMTKEDAQRFFEKKAKQHIGEKKIPLIYGEQEWQIAPEEINLQPKIEEAVENAYAVGRGKGPLQNMAEQLRCAIVGKNIDFTAKYDTEALANKLNSVAHAINAQPQNASVQIQPNGSIKKIPCKIGKQLDTASIASDMEPKLKSMQLPHEIVLQPTEIPPFLLDEDIASINSILASYTTTFYPGFRGDNIILASSRLDNVLVKSGASFSFNTAVGERTAAAGYKNAPVIIDGNIEDGIGGGVCQVSSTLYNAILLAGLTPTARTPHYYPSSYCPPGLDATVVDNLIDFQFKNQYPHNIYLCAHASSNAITIYVLGTKSDLNGCDISLHTEGTALQPSIYRLYSKNRTVIQKEFLHTDTYSSH